MGFIGRALFQQGRFSEAVPLLKEHAQHVDAPMPQAFLAAAYGHLAQASEAQAALARYRALSSQPLEAFAANWLRDPAQRKLFLDGIALAEGKMPPDAVAGNAMSDVFISYARSTAAQAQAAAEACGGWATASGWTTSCWRTAPIATSSRSS